MLSRCASLIIKFNDNLPSINGLVNRDICLLVKKCLLKKLNSETFDNYFILQKHNKNTRKNNYSIRLPRVKSELARQNFYFYGGKLHNELPIGIWKLDTISEFQVALRGHLLWYPFLAIVHGYMFFISTPIFSGLSFFLSFMPYLFPFQEPLFAFCYLCPYSVSSSWLAIVDCVYIFHVWYPLFSTFTF